MAAFLELATLNSTLVSLLPERCHQKIAILDTNLVVPLVTSLVEIEPFPPFKRVKNFSRVDIVILNWLLSQFQSVATNAYVLAESSNLANELNGLNRDRWFEALGKFALITDERHISTRHVAESPLLVKFGITDAALGSLPENYVLITAEHRLSGYLAAAGTMVLNFNDFRLF